MAKITIHLDAHIDDAPDTVKEVDIYGREPNFKIGVKLPDGRWHEEALTEINVVHPEKERK